MDEPVPPKIWFVPLVGVGANDNAVTDPIVSGQKGATIHADWEVISHGVAATTPDVSPLAPASSNRAHVVNNAIYDVPAAYNITAAFDNAPFDPADPPNTLVVEGDHTQEYWAGSGLVVFGATGDYAVLNGNQI